SNIGATRVSAPVGGRIHWRIQPGNMVDADKTVVATIVGPGPMFVDFEADQQVVQRLVPSARPGLFREGLIGLPVEVGLAGEAGFPRHGMVQQVSSQADREGMLRLRAVLANKDSILTGQRVRVRLLNGKTRQALLLPTTAVLSAKEGSTVFV